MSSGTSPSPSPSTLDFVNDVLNYASLLGFLLLLSFFLYHYSFKRCKWEVIFVCATSFILSGIYHVLGNHVPARIRVEGMKEGRSVPWVRLAGYLITCPVLLLHLSNLRGEANYDTFRAMQLVGVFQCVTLCGLTAAMCIDDAHKAFFHLLGGCFAMFLFWRVRQIFVKAFKDFPEEARGHLYVLMFCFFGGWGGFGLTFNLGPEGWALINPVAHNIIVRILDIITKHVYAAVGWSLRWRILYPLAEMGIISQTSKGFVDSSKGEIRPKVLFIGPAASANAVVSFWQKRFSACGMNVVFRKTIASAMQTLRVAEPCEYAFTFVDVKFVQKHETEFVMPLIRQFPIVVYAKSREEANSEILHNVDDMMVAPFREHDVSTVAKYWVIKWHGKRKRAGLSTVNDSFIEQMNEGDVEHEPSERVQDSSRDLTVDKTRDSVNSDVAPGSIRGSSLWRSPSMTNIERLMFSDARELDASQLQLDYSSSEDDVEQGKRSFQASVVNEKNDGSNSSFLFPVSHRPKK